MKRKLIAGMMIVAMTTTLAPLPVLANESAVTASATVTAASGSDERTENSVAKVGDLYYDTLADAFSAITKEGTVELLADVTLNKKIIIQNSQNVTLDLGTYTIDTPDGFWDDNSLFRVRGSLTVQGNGTVNGASEETGGPTYAITVEKGGSFTIYSGTVVGKERGINVVKGSAIIAGGQISNSKSSGTAVYSSAVYVGPDSTVQISGNTKISGVDNAALAEGGSLTLSENVTLSGPSGVILLNSVDNEESAKHATFTMNGGSVTATSRFALAGNNLKSAGCDATITGGSLQQTNGETCIYWPMEGNLTIDGNASVQGGSGIEARMGNITISDQATISGTGKYLTDEPYDGGSQADGSAILISAQKYGASEGQYISSPNLTVNINGGTLNSTNGSALTLYNTKEIKAQEVKVNVTAGDLNAAAGKAGIQAVNMSEASDAGFDQDGNVTATESKTTLIVSSKAAGAAVDQGKNISFYATVNDALDTLSDTTTDANVLALQDENIDGSVLTNENVTLVAPPNVTLWVTTDQSDMAVKETTDKDGNTTYQLVKAEEVDAPAAPSVTLTADRTNAYIGEKIVLTASVETVDSDATYTYTLYRDGKAVERSSSNVFTVTTDGAYAVGVTASKKSGTDTFYSREVMTSAVQCRFVEEPPYTGKYSYEVFTSVGDNGTLTVDRYATEGDKVTIEVAPDEAYLLDELVVTANGKEVELTDNGDGTYTFTMPSADVRISATFAEDPDWTEPEEPATDVSDIFIDVAPNAWYKDAVQYAYAGGLMTGVSANEFAPDATTTRGMIVSMLARLEGVESANDAGFADVEGEWYATAVNWAASVGVVSGYEDNTFRPNDAITREQLAAILMNYASYKGEDVSARADLSAYTDQPSAWAEETMSWAVAEGLISGVTADTLQPQGAATRAQVAAILQRFLSE
ncbi:MAG: S-layer homology domain-containing protein [Peptococcaceae bacterium]|nr:S-layer homology domain-containing protein [Peptococcaceae bacterium]